MFATWRVVPTALRVVPDAPHAPRVRFIDAYLGDAAGISALLTRLAVGALLATVALIVVIVSVLKDARFIVSSLAADHWSRRPSGAICQLPILQPERLAQFQPR